MYNSFRKQKKPLNDQKYNNRDEAMISNRITSVKSITDLHNKDSNNETIINHVTNIDKKKIVASSENIAEYLEESDINILTEELKFDDLIKQEPATEDSKPFVCHYCEYCFHSRSERDTHQQLNHKILKKLEEQNFEAHELELELETGELLKAWKCPYCSLISRRKHHHQTHLIRHSIRENEKELTIKDEEEKPAVVIKKEKSYLIIVQTQSLSAESPEKQKYDSKFSKPELSQENFLAKPT